MRMHKVRPFGIEQPQGAAAAQAEMTLSRTDAAAAVIVPDLRVVDAEVLASIDVKRRRARAKIDRAAAAARGLAADRAVAIQIGDRRVRLAAETHGAAVTGTFEMHGR